MITDEQQPSATRLHHGDPLTYIRCAASFGAPTKGSDWKWMTVEWQPVR